MQKQFDKFMDILKEMFQMDQAELDFGIYRIMNAKRAEIEKFLKEDLLPQVNEEFKKYRGTEVEEKKKKLDEMKKNLKEAGADPDAAPKVIELKEDIAKYGDDEALANDVFSHLASFFRRYYDNGDFISLRRYKKDTYAIPYEGEEVKLHWANADQYYIKTTEYLKDYTFKLPGGQRVHFKLIDATQEKDNNKTDTSKERKFMLSADEPVKIENDELFIQFVYLSDKERQDKHNKTTIEKLSGDLSKKLKGFQDIFAKSPTEKNESRTILERHLNSYTARFNFDFFIHKDLGGFLSRELDFYLKNEVIYIDDLDAQDEQKLKSEVAKAKVIKHIGAKIITFLAQLEEFQKKLWLKKKFVIDCGYCITLDRVPEELYPEIIKNKEQIDEWIGLYAIDEVKGDLTTPGFSKKISVEFLKKNTFLLIDTKYFSEDFIIRLFESIDCVDEKCDGLIINSENFQAINNLKVKYESAIDCIYIDPPYNTNDQTFIYKNDYKDSTWGAMIDSRLLLSKDLLTDAGMLCCAIDDYELTFLAKILDKTLGLENNIGRLIVEIKPSGRTNDFFLATSHEYILFYSNNPSLNKINFFPLTEEQKSEYEESDSQSAYKWRDFLRTGGYSTPQERPNSYYPIYYNPETKDVKLEKLKGYIEILPLDSEGKKRVWRKTKPSFLDHLEKGEIKIIDGRNNDFKIQLIDRMKSGLRPKSVWIGSQYDAASHGTKLLKNIFQDNVNFSFPKSIHAVRDVLYINIGDNEEAQVFDFFAGSGTTGHAVINLNRDDNGKRKYSLVEMGVYFDTVLKPRIMKVVYSKDWKDGKPVSREGISHMFKYMRLESYDDTLDNLVPVKTGGQQKALDLAHKDAQEEYRLKYMLDFETKGSLLNIDKFSDPFNYTINIRKDDELKPCKVDLVETFNYLIGLWVDKIDTIKGFKVITGKLRTGEKTLVIWRNTKEKSNKDLDDFFLKQKYNTLDMEFDLIYVNGDNNLENLRVDENKWKVKLIEEEFMKKMFETEGI